MATWQLGVYITRFDHGQKEFGHWFIQDEFGDLGWSVETLPQRRKDDGQKVRTESWQDRIINGSQPGTPRQRLGVPGTRRSSAGST